MNQQTKKAAVAKYGKLHAAGSSEKDLRKAIGEEYKDKAEQDEIFDGITKPDQDLPERDKPGKPDQGLPERGGRPDKPNQDLPERERKQPKDDDDDDEDVNADIKPQHGESRPSLGGVDPRLTGREGKVKGAPGAEEGAPYPQQVGIETPVAGPGNDIPDSEDYPDVKSPKNADMKKFKKFNAKALFKYRINPDTGDKERYLDSIEKKGEAISEHSMEQRQADELNSQVENSGFYYF